jgi:transcriptional regulator with XRE-family HTH domain
MNFGETIKNRREQLEMTQQELAQKLFVSRQTVCRWENGTRCPDLIMAKKIAITLGISLDDLIPGQEVPEFTPPKEPIIDLSCIKVMLSGIFMLLLGTFLFVADEGNGGIAAFFFIVSIIAFAIGLFIPQDRGKAIIDDELPQRVCPKCGKKHDFDYPQCPHCNYDYSDHGK